MKNPVKRIWHLSLWLMSYIIVHSQILCERGIKVNGIWVFPLYSDTSTYMYLPSDANISLDDEQNPIFSYLRYIVNTPSDNSEKSISEASGGAILDFTVEYGTEQKKITLANEELKKITKNPKATIRNQVTFHTATYTVVSSILQEGKDRLFVLRKGQAPVL